MTYDKPHTLRTVANETDREKRTVQRWYEKACSVSRIELGEVIDGTRHFSDAERDLMLTYMGDKPKFDESEKGGDMKPTKNFKPTRAYTLAKDLDSNTLEQLLYHIRSDAGALILELELALIDKGERSGQKS